MMRNFCIILICTFIQSTYGKLPTLGKESSKQLDDCDSCKILIDSLNHWLKRTSRGKFEGGDADWEENKLRSYSRSEVRLVEVQEGLCSELRDNKDECYLLAEKAEELIEQWWFSEGSVDSDPHTWLCIDKLAYCCPKYHFGPDCLPCPFGSNKELCSGFGRCDGAGTRTGNGKCKCKVGFSGIACNECSKNYFNSGTVHLNCEKCHIACDGCTNSGPGSCVKCQNGWSLNGTICIDDDECSNQPCKVNEYCDNTEGSYACHECHQSCKTCHTSGPNGCIECNSNYFKWDDMCLDQETKQNINNKILYRLLFYLGFVMICYSLSKVSKLLAAVAVISISIYAFYDEYLKHISFLFIK